MYPTGLTTDTFSLSSARDSRAFSVLFDTDFENNITNIRIQKTTIRVDSNSTYDDFEAEYTRSEQKSRLYEVGRAIYTRMVSSTADDYDSKKMVQAYMVYANSIVANYLVKHNNCNRIVLRSQPRIEYTTDLATDFTDDSVTNISILRTLCSE